MPKLIRMDETGHTTLAEWTSADDEAFAEAARALAVERGRGMIASATRRDGSAEVIRELSADAELVILRRPIAGG